MIPKHNVGKGIESPNCGKYTLKDGICSNEECGFEGYPEEDDSR